MEQATIVVVEDDPAILHLMHELLSSEGYRTVLCMESEDAYPLIRRRRPDLVMLDLRMEDPEAGWRILLLLRQEETTAHIPAIMCSGDREFLQLRARILRRKHCAIIEKPFAVDSVLRAVQRALDPGDVWRTLDPSSTPAPIHPAPIAVLETPGRRHAAA